MTDDTERARLERECKVFASYLAGQPATPGIVAAYVDFHDPAARRLPASTRADRFIVRFARLGFLPVRLAAAYSARFRKNALLPSKLVLVLALLECCPPAFESFEVPTFGGTTFVRTRLALLGVTEGLYALAGAIVLGPPHVLLSLLGEKPT